ncbi:MAG TPA: HAD family hydrolase [Mycobacteriales bacterium]|nr:HAD family hydrolase [Mycobacteriales bacterium]
MRPRLVASDLDGTLLRRDGSVSAATRAAIEAVESAGSLFVMVTGRPPRWMPPVVEATGHRGLAVCANGALLYDLHTEQVVRSHLLQRDAAVEVVAALRAAVPGIAFAVEGGEEDFGHEAAYRPRWESSPRRVAPIEDLLSGGTVKLLARHEEMGPDELLAAAREAVGERAVCTHSSVEALLEISASGISKASGLAAVAQEAGISAAECVAFGDMPNDLPMLAWAGLGVAVANAHPDVLAAADEICEAGEHDGVARVLARWF